MATQSKLVIKQGENEVPVGAALTIFDQNSQKFKKIWIGTADEYTAQTSLDADTIYLVQQYTMS